MLDYQYKESIVPKCDAILRTLQEKHPLIKWRYWINHVDLRDDRSPVDSIDFQATIDINRNDRPVEIRITYEMLYYSLAPLDEVIAFQVGRLFVNFIMGADHA